MICSRWFARRNKQRLEHLCDAEWDLLVVDEAHHLVWSTVRRSREYMVIEQLAERVPGVLLLLSHHARAAGDGKPFRPSAPARSGTVSTISEQFVEEQKNYRPIADAVKYAAGGQ